MPKQLTRRDFLKITGITTSGLVLSACGVKVTESPAATPTPTITPTPAPQSLADAPDLSTWVEEYVHAYGGKVTVNGAEMDAEQLTEAIRQNPERFTQTKVISGIKYFFFVLNGAPLAIQSYDSVWVQVTLKIMGNFSGIEIFSTIDPENTKLESEKYWGDEYNGTLVISDQSDSITSRNDFDYSWLDYQIQVARNSGISQFRFESGLMGYDVPGWLTLNVNQDDVDLVLRNNIEHAKSLGIQNIVVVNEAGCLSERKDPYFSKLGENYVIRAFELAHEIYPEANLIYGDANNHIPGYITTEWTKHISKALLEKRLIQSVGVELFNVKPIDLPTEDQLINVFKNYPVPVRITGFNVNLDNVPENQRDDTLNQVVETVFGACIKSKVCKEISLWGNNDSLEEPKNITLRFADNQKKEAYFIALRTLYENLQ